MKNIPKNMIHFLFIICFSLFISKSTENSLLFNKTILNQKSSDKILIKYKSKLISMTNNNNYISIFKKLSRIGYIVCPKGLNIIFELDSIKNIIKEEKKNIFNITIYLKIDRILLLSLIQKSTNKINYITKKFGKYLI